MASLHSFLSSRRSPFALVRKLGSFQIELLLFLALLLFMELSPCISAHATDETKAPWRIIVTSPNHPTVPNLSTDDKSYQTLEWSEATGTLTAKIVYFAPSGHLKADAISSENRVFYMPFPTVKLDAQNNLLIERTFQKALILGHLEEGAKGFRVILQSGVHLADRLQNGVLSASLLSTSTTG